ncbi:MAG: ABC transporter ATP-binding protein [Winkia neuii]|uniref:ABC transporter ATP-binding protein n=1 Tax=Winkia neuii TaxID=33007 RepID=A0A2I1IN01_9ACTO|nr:ABC transporter ATP-binding protein [Winkia neuii]OFJ69448.1 hypothetical protein HMPREF2851_00620 [Actinomyces sp. HMSC064C12]OFK01547.1 hypothetical protein HMPREF2835_01720 [Actinomyces sp. HMSC072A03]OFT54950.1 hypothetical protein HMPREF3152_07055 [Actinomyces sp. HMSC06A08]KWZ73886.1 ABC transporter, ATP-binding protein [Winkia neuii]MDK8100140.1 ABC transporter ATP-binding protein [Winkia neuii]
MSLMQLENVGFYYRADKWVFRDVNLTLEKGQTLSILGKNGAGKSTLLQVALGLATPTEGEARLGGTATTRLSPAKRARLACYLPQTETVNVAYSVTDYLLMGRTPYLGAFSSPRAKDRLRVRKVIAEMGLEDFAGRPINELSGGEKQRVGFARALVQGSPLVVMDEPTSALDMGNQMRTLKKMRELTGEGFAVVATTHDPNQAFLLGGKVALMEKGKPVKVGAAAEVLTSSSLTELFGTPIRVRWDDQLHRHVCLGAERIEER